MYEFHKIVYDNIQVGKYGISFYDDIKSAGIGSFEIFYKYRNKGYGTRAIKYIVNKYKSNYDFIYCYVDADNKDAIRFYKRVGTVSKNKNVNDQYLVTLYKKNINDQYLVTVYKRDNM